jgi:comEA protein
MSQLSPSEKKGLLLLFGIILIGFVIQWLQPYVIKTDLYDYSVQDSVFKAISEDTAGSFAVKDYQTETGEGQINAGISAKSKEPFPHSINVNTASQKEFEQLPRIGPATAKNILEYREKNGSFKSVDELTKVKRIGPKTLELIKPYLTIQ